MLGVSGYMPVERFKGESPQVLQAAEPSGETVTLTLCWREKFRKR